MSAPTPPGWYADPWGQRPLRWWDGQNWTAHLSAPTAPTPQKSPADHVELAAGTSAWLTRLLPVLPVVTFLSIVGFGAVFRGIRDAIDELDNTSPGNRTFDEFFDAFEDVGVWFAVLQVVNVLSLAVMIMRMVWTYRAVSAARGLGRGGSREPALACASWLIPILNLWWPYEAMRDTFPEAERPTQRLTTWWASYLVALLGNATMLAAFFFSMPVVILTAAIAALPSVVSVVHERRLITESTELLRRDATVYDELRSPDGRRHHDLPH